MKRLAIIFIIVSIFLLTGCENKRDLYILPEDAKIEINNKTIEVFKLYKLYDLIGNTNMEINTKDTNIDTETIGEHTMIGLGSVVVRDIPDHVTAYGNPCKAEVK